ncbi:hypothetical protein [Burkholderia catarinensis]|uniref:hypothetical protein n=1 Tax=Burkholderia catarinensis TaxID=1108140 RepID=UPI0010082884|nr:hypothetical protein [Burkholderia catarinensis]KAG8150293.1 hypothetical protein BFF94_027790 [Burkholderia catarinensis]
MSTLPSDTLRDQARFYGRILFGLQIFPWIVMGTGILSGQAHDIWDFMNPSHGDVLLATAFWGVIAATASGTAWWIFTGGARKVVELRLMDQFGYPAENVTERTVKAMAITMSIGVIALLIGCTLIGGPSLRNALTSLTGNASPAVSGDAYRIVFDCANGGCANWTFPALGLCFVAIGVVFVWFRNDLPMQGPAFMRKVFPFIWLGFAILWTTIAFGSTYGAAHRIRNAIASGEVRVVEGDVTAFEPMPYGGHAMERFCVRQVCFSYSDYVITGGFNNTASHGGPIRSGLPVKVSYVDGLIVKLEVAPMQ